MLAGAPGTGIPNPYPLAINSPLDRAYLRPLQEPIYDTENFDFTSSPTSLTYFQRPISQSTANVATTKDFDFTNLTQASMLDYPREFSILGFNIVFDTMIGMQSLVAILRRAYVQFTFSGRRPYLTCQLHRFPQGIGPTGAVSSTVAAGAGDSGKQAFGTNGMPLPSNIYKFNLGRAALKIKPGEAFNAKITWPVAVANSNAGTPTTLGSSFGFTPASPAAYMIAFILVGLDSRNESRVIRMSNAKKLWAKAA